MKSSVAVAIALGFTGAALIRSAQVRGALRREAELLGLRAYLAAVDGGGSHQTFVSELRNADQREDGSWLARAYGAGCNGSVPSTVLTPSFERP